MALSDAISHLARRAGEAATGYISGADVIATVAQIYADLSARGFTLDRPRLSGYVDGYVDGVARMRAYVADGSARHDFVIQRLPVNGTPVTILRLDADTGALEVGAPTGASCAARLVDLSTMHTTITGEIAAAVAASAVADTGWITWVEWAADGSPIYGVLPGNQLDKQPAAVGGIYGRKVGDRVHVRILNVRTRPATYSSAGNGLLAYFPSGAWQPAITHTVPAAYYASAGAVNIRLSRGDNAVEVDYPQTLGAGGRLYTEVSYRAADATPPTPTARRSSPPTPTVGEP